MKNSLQHTKIKNLLFDFDGTLADTANGIVKTMEQTFIHMGVAVPTAEAMRATIGLPLIQALQQLANFSNADAQRAADTYRDLFPIYEAQLVSIFPQVEETLEQLKDDGMRMAIVTSRNLESLELICQKRNFMRFFETLITCNDQLKPKPAPDMVLTLLQRMNIKPQETLVIGDTTYDIQMGNSAGCNTCAVTYGNHTRQQLAAVKPTYIINDFHSLIKIK